MLLILPPLRALLHSLPDARLLPLSLKVNGLLRYPQRVDSQTPVLIYNFVCVNVVWPSCRPQPSPILGGVGSCYKYSLLVLSLLPELIYTIFFVHYKTSKKTRLHFTTVKWMPLYTWSVVAPPIHRPRGPIHTHT